VDVQGKRGDKMLVVTFVGARKRSSIRERNALEHIEEIQKDDRFLVSSILIGLVNRFHEIHVVSYACDDGIGKIVKEVCLEKRIKFGEIVWYFHGENRWEPDETSRAYLTRNATAEEIGDIFIILAKSSDSFMDRRKGIVEDLVDRLRKRADLNDDDSRPYVVLSEDGSVLEGFKTSSIL
jgi:hypothetical protein